MTHITDLIVPMNVVLTVSTTPVTTILDPVHKAVRRGSMETSVTRPVVLAVTRAVTDTMEAVRVNKAGKARHVVVNMLLSSFKAGM